MEQWDDVHWRLLDNDSLVDAIVRGHDRAVAEGREPSPEVAASWLAAKVRLHYDAALWVVLRVLGEMEAERVEWELETRLAGECRYQGFANHGYTI